MLPVSQVIRETTILQRDPGIYDSGSTAIVVNEERLKHTGTMFFCKKTANIVMVLWDQSENHSGNYVSEIPCLGTVHGRYLQTTGLS